MKKNQILLIFCLLATQYSFAQTEIIAQKNRQFGLVFGMDENYRVLFESKKSPSMGIVKSVRDENEKPILCGRIGIDFWKKWRKNKTIHTGIRFAQQGYVVQEKDNLVWASEMASGMIDPNLPHSIKIVDKNYFVEIPFAVQFDLKTIKNWHFFAETGLSYLLYLKTIRNTTLGNDKLRLAERQDISPIHFMVTAGAGIERNFGKKTNLFLQPTARFQITPLKFGVPVHEYPFNFGLLMGVRRSF